MHMIGEELRRIDEYIEHNHMSDAHGGPQMICDGSHAIEVYNASTHDGTVGLWRRGRGPKKVPR